LQYRGYSSHKSAALWQNAHYLHRIRDTYLSKYECIQLCILHVTNN
jgi:hypothetical protein